MHSYWRKITQNLIFHRDNVIHSIRMFWRILERIEVISHKGDVLKKKKRKEPNRVREIKATQMCVSGQNKLFMSFSTL